MRLNCALPSRAGGECLFVSDLAVARSRPRWPPGQEGEGRPVDGAGRLPARVWNQHEARPPNLPSFGVSRLSWPWYSPAELRNRPDLLGVPPPPGPAAPKGSGRTD